MQCCCTLNTGCCKFYHPNIVSFDNLKTKYPVNQDIHIEYTLHEDVQQASTRDWLGIFPRGWTNLQQYLTFEYALVAPRAAASSNRTIIFPRVFHQEASTHTEYQLVYVSREIQVLATSSYFRFIHDDKTDVAKNHILHVPYRVPIPFSEEYEIHPNQLATSGWTPPQIVVSDQSLLSLHPSRTISANPRLPRAYRSCGRPCNNACRLTEGRARFLATHNASLIERVVRLERNLALAEGAKFNLTERLGAYEKFVMEMLRSLATKRVVKITDASGKEIILQQVTAETEVRIENGLKKFSSENNISHRNVDRPEVNDLSEEENLSTNDRALIGEHLSKELKSLPTKSDPEITQVQEELAEDYQTVVEKNRVSSDVETQTQKIEAKSKCIGNTSVGQNCEDTIQVSECYDEIVKESETLETSVVDNEEQKEVIEKRNWTDPETEKSDVVLQPKPSAIVIQGSNVKFAIIRY